MVIPMQTTRFGTVAAEAGDVIHFPLGLPGLENLDRWLLLADTAGGNVGWLQSVDCSDIALAVVDPCRFVADYALHVGRKALGPVGGGAVEDMRILTVVSQDGEGLTLNLKAPLVVDLRRRLGCQVLNQAEWPLGYSLEEKRIPLRRCA